MTKTFAILEGNMERLQKKITRIQNKCKKYGCGFHFAEVGEEYREVKDYGRLDPITGKPATYTARFILVEAEGVAVVNGWKFIASVEHTEKGNIINKACGIEVPERYYTSDPVCEHCNTKRFRKDTFIVMNEETGGFKQVGKSCLADYTHGMSAEGVAQYTAAFEEIIKGEEPYEGCSYTRYIGTEEFLRYVAETIRHFGYVKNDCDKRSTRDRAADYYGVEHGWHFIGDLKEKYRNEMLGCGFNAESDEAKAEAAKALEWLDDQSEENNYMHNLKVACSLDHVSGRNLGILASLFPTYNRELVREEQRKLEVAKGAASEYVGKVGDRVEIKVDSVKLITSWETMYGVTFVWKITGEDGNIYTWKTNNIILEDVVSIKGTVKEHKEFRGVKQTELTRCKCAACKDRD